MDQSFPIEWLDVDDANVNEDIESSQRTDGRRTLLLQEHFHSKLRETSSILK